MVRLDGEHDHVDQTYGLGVVESRHVDREVAFGASDSEAVGSERREVLATCEAAEVASDTTCAEYCESHLSRRKRGSRSIGPTATANPSDFERTANSNPGL